MTEEVRTGGTKKFVAGKRPEIEPELAKKIEKGYEKAEERKRRERRNKIIIIIIVVVILIILGVIFFL